MSPSTLQDASYFFSAYAPAFKGESVKVVDIGSLDVNGSLRGVCPPNFEYIGVDFAPGKGVDVVLDDPYRFPFADKAFDVVVTSSCFEHSEFFWLTFLECLRIAKDDGLIYINVPNNAAFHRYPVDCWRFYPDSGQALQNWGRRSGYDCELLESYVADQGDHGMVNDFVAVFVKTRSHAARYPARMVDQRQDFTNGHSNRSAEILRLEWETEDQRNLMHMRIRAFRRRIKWAILGFFGVNRPQTQKIPSSPQAGGVG